ncbi:DUF177 domain-containing protein [Candidatus Omnitrophota bacterium]
MKILVDKIPEEGLKIIEQLDPHALSLELDGQAIDFIKSIDVKARAMKTGREVFVDISVETPVEYTCTRCLAKFQDIFKKRFNVNYEIEPGDILEVDEDIRQEMILDYPIKMVCKSDCKGLCPNCGQNLNVAKCECIKGDRGQSTENRGLDL